MHVIHARNVHDALPLGLDHLGGCGIPMGSRAGEVLVAPTPVTTVYTRPIERVLFYPERDANPFFHLFEALWMLAGRKDVGFLNLFVKNFGASFSDDGQTVHGAYGARWRRHWVVDRDKSRSPDWLDQIKTNLRYLKKNPMGRRAVLQMWDPEVDLFEDEEGHRDVPCNTTIYLNVSYGKRDEPNRLNMTLCCRSNDIIWGAMGANAVHFSILQEYLAASLGLVVGTLYQVSNNYHAYREVYDKVRRAALALGAERTPSPYETNQVKPYPLVADPVKFDRALEVFFQQYDAGRHSPSHVLADMYADPFFREVVDPLWMAHNTYRDGDFPGAMHCAAWCKASDWKVAALNWLARRWDARLARDRKTIAAEVQQQEGRS